MGKPLLYGRMLTTIEGMTELEIHHFVTPG